MDFNRCSCFSFLKIKGNGEYEIYPHLLNSNPYYVLFDVQCHSKTKYLQTRVLKAINASLKKDGFFLMQDIAASTSSMVDKNIDSPLAPALYTISTMHCMSVSLAYNGEGLGTMWGIELAIKKLTEAGFKDIKVKNVEGDIINYLSRKS